MNRLQRPSARESVFELLHEWIANNVLKPGERMNDYELAERLGVSRTPVREALRMLEDAGLVHTARNRWTRVAPIELQDAHDICPIIWTLEPLAIRLGGDRDLEPDLEALEDANLRVAEEIEGGTRADAEVADNRFHELLVDQSGNPEIAKILGHLRVKWRRIALAHLKDGLITGQSVADHAAMIDALRAADHERAAELSEANWRKGYERFCHHASEAEASGTSRS